MNKKTYSFWFLIVLLLCIPSTIGIKRIFCFEQDKQHNQLNIALGKGITVNIDRIRTWKIFDCDFPGWLQHEHWISSNLTIQKHFSSPRPIQAAKATYYAEYYSKKRQAIFSMVIENFAPYDFQHDEPGPMLAKETKVGFEEKWGQAFTVIYERFNPSDYEEGIKASGTFLELLLWFYNLGKKESVVWFNTKGKNLMDSHLILNKQKIYAKAFLIPGLEIAWISLVTAWEGELGITLKQGEKTWLLLIFDIPEGYRSARFQLKNASPVPIKLPYSE